MERISADEARTWWTIKNPNAVVNSEIARLVLVPHVVKPATPRPLQFRQYVPGFSCNDASGNDIGCVRCTFTDYEIILRV
jgi:hypothetical protein